MAFDFEKWALSFYGVLDERFVVETDVFQLHIHRENNIKSLVVKRSEGVLAIYIPHDWNMEKFQCQEKLRRLLLSEVKQQAQKIFENRTMLYAKRYNIPCEKVELESRYRYIGKCYPEKKMIKYNPWVICCAYQRHIKKSRHEPDNSSDRGHPNPNKWNTSIVLCAKIGVFYLSSK